MNAPRICNLPWVIGILRLIEIRRECEIRSLFGTRFEVLEFETGPWTVGESVSKHMFGALKEVIGLLSEEKKGQTRNSKEKKRSKLRHVFPMLTTWILESFRNAAAAKVLHIFSQTSNAVLHVNLSYTRIDNASHLSILAAAVHVRIVYERVKDTWISEAKRA